MFGAYFQFNVPAGSGRGDAFLQLAKRCGGQTEGSCAPDLVVRALVAVVLVYSAFVLRVVVSGHSVYFLGVCYERVFCIRGVTRRVFDVSIAPLCRVDHHTALFPISSFVACCGLILAGLPASSRCVSSYLLR
jgi:hypothetical protein